MREVEAQSVKIGPVEIRQGDALEVLKTLPNESVNLCVTSPPYWGLRDYGVAGQIGLERTWRDHMKALLPIFAQVKRVLTKDGNLFVNYGDTVAQTGRGFLEGGYGFQGRPANSQSDREKSLTVTTFDSTAEDPAKHKLGLPWRFRFMLNDELGFISRSDIVWHKRNQMPLSVKDRMTPKHEFVFHFVKQQRYFFNLDPIRTPYKPGSTILFDVAAVDSQYEGKRQSKMGGSESSGPAFNIRASEIQANRFKLRVRDAQKGRLDAKWGQTTKVADWEVEEYNEQEYAKHSKNNVPGGTSRSTAEFHKNWRPESSNPGNPNGVRPPPEAGEPGGPDENGQYNPLGANPGDVWDIPSQPLAEAHFATYPEKLIERIILCSSPEGGMVLDPFFGSGTTGLVAAKLGRRAIGIELNPAYIEIAARRLRGDGAALSEKAEEWV